MHSSLHSTHMTPKDYCVRFSAVIGKPGIDPLCSVSACCVPGNTFELCRVKRDAEPHATSAHRFGQKQKTKQRKRNVHVVFAQTHRSKF